MSEVNRTPEALAYLEEIACEMVTLFGISIEEARGRVTREFEGRSLLSELEVNVLLHEEQDTWAGHIYYGRDSFWWLGASALEPRPFP